MGLVSDFGNCSCGFENLAAARRQSLVRQSGKVRIIGLAAFLVTSSYWLVPLALAREIRLASISSFGANDQSAFATVATVGSAGSATWCGCKVFGAEDRGLYNLPQDSVAGVGFAGADGLGSW